MVASTLRRVTDSARVLEPKSGDVPAGTPPPSKLARDSAPSNSNTRIDRQKSGPKRRG